VSSLADVRSGGDLQSLFGLHVHSCSHWVRPRNPPPPPRIWAPVYSCTQWLRLRNPSLPLPPAFGLIYEGAIAIGQPRFSVDDISL
jgi:hypothetical protein